MTTRSAIILSLVILLYGCGGSSDATQSGAVTDPAINNDNSNQAANSTPLRWSLPASLHQYANRPLPTHFTSNQFPGDRAGQTAASASDNTPANNPITDAGATLGRVLFYDPWLSQNRQIACASCHQQAAGFSDPNRLSRGFDGGETRRHSMGLSNARFYSSGKFFWDERAETLEQQVLQPIQDPLEMGMTLPELEIRLAEDSNYQALFQAAFADEQITSERIALALAQFIRSLDSFSARYDVGRAQVSNPITDFPNFSAEENQGKRLFFGAGSCSGCHSSEAFIAAMPNNPNLRSNGFNNGLEALSSDDLGIAESSGNPRDEGKFKVGSLRNIAVTAPYMHDGRLATLAEVVRFYNQQIQPHPNLAPILQDPQGNPRRFNFSDAEQRALVAFMETLTDSTFLSDPRFADPFID
ncbi:cytochrome-c peroxidase [Ferrimonas senticii]|uniref:cytochrome-c peroxidase n=1 Tax=Ferrimonas senticii TaxID=394566 RepID=UPI0004091BE5|nr:cytochrome c peroxidase [Ferrimonas senticii]